MPGTDSEYSDASDTTTTYPYMATVRRGIHLLGFPSQTTNAAVEHGVYSFGAINKDFNDAFGLSYTVSTGTLLNTGGSLRLGHVKSYGDTLLVSWRDNDSGYGLDRIDNSSDPFAAATWESLWFDGNAPFKHKSGQYIICTFEPLPSGASLVLKYRTERGGTWTSSEAFTSANTTDGRAKLQVHPSRFLQLQGGFDITVTGTATPTITSWTLVYDDNRSEEP